MTQVPGADEKHCSKLKNSSWLAGIVYASNPWSLKQPSIGSSSEDAFAAAWPGHLHRGGPTVPATLKP